LLGSILFWLFLIVGGILEIVYAENDDSDLRVAGCVIAAVGAVLSQILFMLYLYMVDNEDLRGIFRNQNPQKPSWKFRRTYETMDASAEPVEKIVEAGPIPPEITWTSVAIATAKERLGEVGLAVLMDKVKLWVTENITGWTIDREIDHNFDIDIAKMALLVIVTAAIHVCGPQKTVTILQAQP